MSDDFNWASSVRRDVQVGDRIKLVDMPNDPHPIESGTEGTVKFINTGVGIVGVEWDNGSSLNLVIGLDSYELLNESSDSQIINKSMPSPTLKGGDVSSARTNMNKTFKSELSKGGVKDIKVESEEQVVGGKGDKLTPEDIAKKHSVDIKDIQKEIEIGLEVEMEHTDKVGVAKEIVLDHLTEFPDYYSNEKYGLKASEKNLEKVHENFFGGMGNAFGDKQESEFDNQKLGDDLKKITSEIGVDKPKKETIKDMIEDFRSKYSQHPKIDTMMKSLYHEFDGISDDIEETTSAGSSGAFSGPLGGVQKRNESRIFKVKDLLEGTTTQNTDRTDGTGPFDGSAWVDMDGDGWMFDDKPAWEGGEIVDILATTKNINWRDDNLDISSEIPKEKKTKVKLKKEDLIRTIRLLENKEYAYIKFSKDDTQGTMAVELGSPNHTNMVNGLTDLGFTFTKISKDEYDEYNEGGEEITIQELYDKHKDEIDETTTASSSGQYSGQMFAAKDDDSWNLGKKPIWTGGKIVQKVKNSGVLSEINKVKWHKDGEYVKLKDTCVKFKNQPWCSAGDADKPLILSKTTSDNISEVAKKYGISEDEVKKLVINKLTR